MRKTGGLRSYIAYFKKLSFIYVTPLKFLPFFSHSNTIFSGAMLLVL